MLPDFTSCGAHAHSVRQFRTAALPREQEYVRQRRERGQFEGGGGQREQKARALESDHHAGHRRVHTVRLWCLNWHTTAHAWALAHHCTRVGTGTPLHTYGHWHTAFLLGSKALHSR
jgi:hypothetical protein